MKISICDSFILSIISAASVASATDYIFDYEKYGAAASISWSETLGTVGESGSGYWYWTDDQSIKHYIEGANVETSDNFTFGDASMTNKLLLNFDQDVSLGNFNIISASSSATANISGSNRTASLTVNGNLISTTPASSSISNSISAFNNLNILGDYTSNLQYGGVTSCNHIYIGGDYQSVMQNLSTYMGNGSIENPDIEIAGIVKNTNRLVITNASSTNDLYYVFGGLNNTSIVRMGAQNKTNIVHNVILNNAAGTKYSMGGSFIEVMYVNDKAILVDPLQRMRVKITANMSSDATQKIGGDNTWNNGRDLMISGGIEVNNGNLRVRFNQRALEYIFTATYAKDGESSKRFNVSFWTQNDETGVQTTFSHGNLTLNSGSFGCDLTDWTHTSGVTTYGSFRFTNIVYNGGTILLRLKDSSYHDYLDLTSYYQKEVNAADTENIYYTLQEGGTIIKDDSKKVNFDFGNTKDSDLYWLIDSTENDGKGVLIIAADAGKMNDFGNSDFIANSIVKDDIEYNALFSTDDQGLYVKYSQVPEPATVGMLFGAAAVVFAYARRRRN